jgi:hypothetical protein
MNHTLLRDKWIGPSDEVFISFDVYDEEFGTLVWSSDYFDVTEIIIEIELTHYDDAKKKVNEFREEIIEQCKTFKLTVDLTADLPTEWGEEWEERVLT